MGSWVSTPVGLSGLCCVCKPGGRGLLSPIPESPENDNMCAFSEVDAMYVFNGSNAASQQDMICRYPVSTVSSPYALWRRRCFVDVGSWARNRNRGSCCCWLLVGFSSMLEFPHALFRGWSRCRCLLSAMARQTTQSKSRNSYTYN